MEQSYIIAKINQRMEELGYTKFHYESIRIKNIPYGPYALDFFSNEIIQNNRYGSMVAEIDASNQFYYLVDKMVNPDLKITSDTGYLLPSEISTYGTNTIHNLKEFTGQIFITSLNNFDLEFLKVTPYKTIN